MDTRTLSIGFLSLALIGGAGAWAFAQGGQAQPPAAPSQPKAAEKDGDEEEVITLDKAPEAVRNAAVKLAGDAKNITKVIKEEDDEDVVTFEVEYTAGTGADAVKCAAIFSIAGDLMEIEKATAEAKLPAAALAALKKQYPKATFADQQSVTKMFYEVTVVVDGKKHAVKVEASGTIEDESAAGKAHAEKDEGKEEKAAAVSTVRGKAPGADGWRAEFAVKKADLVATGAGTYFVLTPGHTMTYVGGDTTLVVKVLNETKVLDGVTTRVVEEHETKAGTLVEISRNYFALEPASGDVYYFGEDVDIYKDGKVANHEGSWHSGVDGATFGLFIPGKAVLGDRYYQELAPGNALDRFEIASISEHLSSAAGEFEKVVKTEETTPLEAGKSYKWFAPGTGMVRDGELTLTKIEPAPAKK